MDHEELENYKWMLLEDFAEASEKTFDDTLVENQDRGKPSYKSREEILTDHRELLREVFGDGPRSVPLVYMIADYCTHEVPVPANREEELRILKMDRLFALIEIEWDRRQIADRNTGLSPWTVYHLGERRAELRYMEQEIDHFDTKQDWSHRRTAANYARKRYKSKYAATQTALKEAEQEWINGSLLFRHEMAERLCIKYPELSKNTLNKELTDLADKYGKGWNASLPRGKRTTIGATKKPEPQRTPRLRIVAKCATCDVEKTIIQGWGERIQSRPQKKCAVCGEIYLFNTYWDGREDPDEDFQGVCESIDEYNEEYCE